MDTVILLGQLSLALNLIIRMADEADIRALEWHGQFWHFRGLFERSYQEMLAGRRLLLVADLDGYPVARLFIQLAAGHPRYADGSERAYLYSLHVMPPLQGLGIGTSLLTAAERLLVERGFRWASIAAAKDNPRARALYERLGYHVIAENPGKWSYTDPDGMVHHVDEPSWILGKELAPRGQYRTG
jgi:ribosomal protein S18 acetylase RimI-like enzyme